MSSIPENPVSTWSEYFATVLTKPLHPLFEVLEPYLPGPGRAIDLGCGVGHAVVWLAEKGWDVTAVDVNPEALEIVKSRLTADLEPRVHLMQSAIQDAKIAPDTYDLIVASYSLFFVPPEDFPQVWASIRAGVKAGGLFVGELLGPNDDWAERYFSFSREELDELFEDFEVVHLEEAEQDGMTSVGVPKHWHVYHYILRAKGFSS
jgi:SAM-dependent methyltransferase